VVDDEAFQHAMRPGIAVRGTALLRPPIAVRRTASLPLAYGPAVRVLGPVRVSRRGRPA
jgi:hypothetical protein